MLAVVPLRLARGRPAAWWPSPADPASPDRDSAIEALCGMPDPRAVSVYLAAIEDRDPRLRKAGEMALLAIRDRGGGRARLGCAVGSALRDRRRCLLDACSPGSSRSAIGG